MITGINGYRQAFHLKIFLSVILFKNSVSVYRKTNENGMGKNICFLSDGRNKRQNGDGYETKKHDLF